MIEPYLSFLVSHWLLSGAFVLLLALFLFNEWRQHVSGVPKLTNQELVDLLNHAGAQVLDIRAQGLFEQGHILGAINIPHEELAARVKILNKYKNKSLIVVCANGTLSPKMSRELKAQGFTELYYLAQGMEGWLQESLPMSKK